MSKKKKVIIILIILPVIVGAVVFINISPMLSMSPIESGEIPGSGIYAVKSGVNSVFFIESGSQYIAVDAGTDASKLKDAMDKADISPLDVSHLLLTHSDYDHLGGLTLFKNADIYMSEDELQLINGTTKRNLFGRNALPEGILAEDLILLTEGQKLVLNGLEIECVKTPGHTTGSMSYIVNGEYIFTGDAFMVEGNSMKPHPFTMDGAAAKNSIKKLAEIKGGCSLVITAHYGVFNAEKLQG